MTAEGRPDIPPEDLIPPLAGGGQASRRYAAQMLAIKSNEKLWAWTEEGPMQVRADRLASQVAESDWARLSAGEGSKGPRMYDWTWVAIRPIREEGKGYWLLVRRSVSQPEELAYYVCYGLGETTPEELVKVAGIRWTIEECFEEAKGLVELDQYEVRKWEGWCRHVTLAMLAHAYLAVVRLQANVGPGGKRGRRGLDCKPDAVHGSRGAPVVVQIDLAAQGIAQKDPVLVALETTPPSQGPPLPLPTPTPTP